MAENAVLKTELKYRKSKINTLEQKQLENHMAIHGVSSIGGSDKMNGIVKKISNILQVAIGDDDIVTLEPIKNKESIKPILIWFSNLNTKLNLLKKVKEHRPIKI